MKIKSCYTLKEFLRPIHIEKFLSYIEKTYGNILDDIEVKKSDKEKTLEFPNEILKRIPDFIEFSKKYGFELIRRNENSFALRADDLKLINNKYDKPIHFPSLDFSNYMGKFFHISKTSPDIIMNTGLRVKDSKNNDDRFEGHSPRIYLISVERIYETYKDKIKNLKDLKKETEDTIENLAADFEYNFDQENFLYEVTIPKNYTMYEDQSTDFGIYVKNNIQPKNIKYIKKLS